MTVQFIDLHPALADLRREVLYGLQQPQKSIPPKLLYDQQGSALFDQICLLDEYYLTRTEIRILETFCLEMANLIGDGILVEFGSGSSHKVRILLDHLPQLSAYVALDISKDHLQNACQELAQFYPSLPIVGVCADFSQPIPSLDLEGLHQRRVGFFPGSSIGNFEPHEAIEFLRTVAHLLGSEGDLLIGVDLKKSAQILEPAYDDARGISAAFALNLLNRINRELQADFEVARFRYHSFYNSVEGRIEMGLQSLCQQRVHIHGVPIEFEAGETLRTEYSYKYTVEEFQELAQLAGFHSKQVWTDPNEWFSLHYLHL